MTYTECLKVCTNVIHPFFPTPRIGCCSPRSTSPRSSRSVQCSDFSSPRSNRSVQCSDFSSPRTTVRCSVVIALLYGATVRCNAVTCTDFCSPRSISPLSRRLVQCSGVQWLLSSEEQAFCAVQWRSVSSTTSPRSRRSTALLQLFNKNKTQHTKLSLVVYVWKVGKNGYGECCLRISFTVIVKTKATRTNFPIG